MRKLGHSSFIAAISKYHGGLSKFRKFLGQEELKIKNGLWKNEEYIIAGFLIFLLNNLLIILLISLVQPLSTRGYR